MGCVNYHLYGMPCGGVIYLKKRLDKDSWYYRLTLDTPNAYCCLVGSLGDLVF